LWQERSPYNRRKVLKVKAIKAEDVLEIGEIIEFFPIKESHYSSGTVP
jgi:hypothetical protein